MNHKKKDTQEVNTELPDLVILIDETVLFSIII